MREAERGKTQSEDQIIGKFHLWQQEGPPFFRFGPIRLARSVFCLSQSSSSDQYYYSYLAVFVIIHEPEVAICSRCFTKEIQTGRSEESRKHRTWHALRRRSSTMNTRVLHVGFRASRLGAAVYFVPYSSGTKAIHIFLLYGGGGREIDLLLYA